MADNIDKILERDGVVDLCLALQSLKPGAQWILRGDNYSGLEWIDDIEVKERVNIHKLENSLTCYIMIKLTVLKRGK